MKRPVDPDIKLLQAAADPTRLAILHQLSSDGSVCACDFTACCAVHQPTVSHHLRVLREAGWVDAERHGTSIFYAIRPEAIVRFHELASGLSAGAARPIAKIEVVGPSSAVASDPALALPPMDSAPIQVDHSH
jgi:ArsR family transcriptional regulator